MSTSRLLNILWACLVLLLSGCKDASIRLSGFPGNTQFLKGPPKSTPPTDTGTPLDSDSDGIPNEVDIFPLDSKRGVYQNARVFEESLDLNQIDTIEMKSDSIGNLWIAYTLKAANPELFPNQIQLLKYSSLGVKLFEGTLSCQGDYLTIGDTAIDEMGALYLSGSFSGICDFDPTGMIQERNSQKYEQTQLEAAYLLKINSNGSFNRITVLTSSGGDSVFGVRIGLGLDGKVALSGAVWRNPDSVSTDDTFTVNPANYVFLPAYRANAYLNFVYIIDVMGKPVGTEPIYSFGTARISPNVKYLQFDHSENLYVYTEDAVDEGGTAFIDLLSKYSLATGKLDQLTLDHPAHHMTVDSANNLYVMGKKPQVSDATQTDLYLMQINTTNLELGWVQTFGSDGNDAFPQIQSDGDFLYIAGVHKGKAFKGMNGVDTFTETLESDADNVRLAKLSTAGNMIWSLSYPIVDGFLGDLKLLAAGQLQLGGIAYSVNADFDYTDAKDQPGITGFFHQKY